MPNPIGRCVPAELTTIEPTSLSLGHHHGCVLGKEGRPFCWNENGNGDGGPRRPVPAVADVAALSTGQAETCALLKDATVTCWSAAFAIALTPPPLAPHQKGLANVTQLAMGELHGCALLTDKTVGCWGSSEDHPREPEQQWLPWVVDGVADASSIAVYESRACAVLHGGAVACWDIKSATPHVATVVAGLPPVARIALGGRHACAMLQNQQVTCWGANFDGQLADGTETDRASPQLTPDKRKFSWIAAASNHTVMVADGGSLECWGAYDRVRYQ